MKRYTVIWLYIANSGVISLTARDADHAISRVLDDLYAGNHDFRAKANFFAFEGDPVAEKISERYPEKIFRWS